jgi:hypothetical protein
VRARGERNARVDPGAANLMTAAVVAAMRTALYFVARNTIIVSYNYGACARVHYDMLRNIQVFRYYIINL